MIKVTNVTVYPEQLEYTLEFDSQAPHRTSEDTEAVNRLYQLMPGIAKHECYGDKGASFKAAMADTEFAHLIEHIVIELIARTGRTQGVAFGQTKQLGDHEFLTQLDCQDDTLTMACVATGVWLANWSLNGKQQHTPSIEALVTSICKMVDGIDHVEFQDTIIR